MLESIEMKRSEWKFESQKSSGTDECLSKSRVEYNKESDASLLVIGLFLYSIVRAAHSPRVVRRGENAMLLLKHSAIEFTQYRVSFYFGIARPARSERERRRRSAKNSTACS